MMAFILLASSIDICLLAFSCVFKKLKITFYLNMSKHYWNIFNYCRKNFVSVPYMYIVLESVNTNSSELAIPYLLSVTIILG